MDGVRDTDVEHTRFLGHRLLTRFWGPNPVHFPIFLETLSELKTPKQEHAKKLADALLNDIDLPKKLRKDMLKAVVKRLNKFTGNKTRKLQREFLDLLFFDGCLRSVKMKAEHVFSKLDSTLKEIEAPFWLSVKEKVVPR